MSKRISKKKLAANRRNARKSTGPKTPEGKAIAAKNATKHGLLSNAVVVNSAHESQTDFDLLLDDLRQDLQPNGPTQDALVERAATCYWRLRRAQRYESGCIEQNFANLFDPTSDNTSPPDCLADIANLPEEDDLKNLIRYESMIDRQLHRALHELRQQQKQKAANARNVPQASSLQKQTDASPNPTTSNLPQVQLPPRLSTLDLGPVGGQAANETNPITPKTAANSKQTNNLTQEQNDTSNLLNSDNSTPDRSNPANHDQNLRFNDYPTSTQAQKQKVRQAM